MLAIAHLSFHAGHYLITENIFNTLIGRQCHSQDDHICSGLLHMRSASPRKGARGNRPAPHRLQRGQSRRISGSTAPGGSATDPSRGAAGPACLFRTGRQCAVFRFFRLDDRIPQSLLLALACSVCDNRHGQVAVVNAPLFVPCCALVAKAWVFLSDFITLLSRFRHLIRSALRKVTVKNFFNE